MSDTLPRVGEPSHWDGTPFMLPPLPFRGRVRWALPDLLCFAGITVSKAARALREYFLPAKIYSREIAMHVTKNKLAKFGQIFLYSFSYPGLAKRSVGQLYNSIAIAEGKIPPCPISEFVPRPP